MPTGYTAKMYDGEDQGFPEFALRCARNFGALFELRDDPHTTIPVKIEPSPCHKKSLAAATEELSRWLSMSDEEVAEDLEQERRRRLTAEREAATQSLEVEQRYRAMLDEVEAWDPPTPDHVRLKEFMVEQITSSIKHDCGLKYKAQPMTYTPAEWRELRTASAIKSINYHKDGWAAEVDRAARSTAWVQALMSSLSPTKEKVS